MGVTGCGKSTIGQLLATRLSLTFRDADNFHSIANIAKMNKGISLQDEDRIPWLNDIAHLLKNKENEGGVVLACSALKQSYRNILQKELKNDIIWVHLNGSQALIAERLKFRNDHFMSPALLSSQFETLEVPNNALCFSIEKNPGIIVDEIIKEITK